MLRARVGGEDVTVPEAEWDRLAADIGKAGLYPVRMDAAELAGCPADPAALDRLFRSEIAAQLQRWCDLAAERLDPAVRCIITPGNDDPVDADAVLAAHGRVECPELELCDLGPVDHGQPRRGAHHPVEHRAGVHRRTSWPSRSATCSTRCPMARPCILNLHCPPYASGLDDAPELDATLKPVIRGGRPSIIPVGSHAVRDAIQRYQPSVGLHGHIHESRGAQKIGRTLCVNPGSDYSSGVLRGAVVDIAQDGSCLDFLLTTG